MKSNQTCGPLFLECVKEFVSDINLMKIFSAGHMTGQAEKIYLGACAAAMFRPNPEYQEWALVAALKIANIYKLEVSVFEREEMKNEIWIHAPTATREIAMLKDVDFNSPEWHTLRGRLCGVPEYNLDTEFHLRYGYNIPCDKPAVED